MLDVFNGDAFTMASLTEAIDMLPYVPGYLGKKGLFPSKGVTTTTVVLDQREGSIVLIPTAARGARDTVNPKRPRHALPLLVPHLPLDDAVMADDVQGIRAFGQETATETISGRVNDKLGEMKQSFEATWEHMRVGAISGNILDADGVTSVLNLFTAFGLTESSVEFDFSDDTEDIKALALDIIRLIRDALGATPFTGVEALCSDTFFDALTSHPKVTTAYERWQTGEFLRTQQYDTGFPFAGIMWKNYRGKVGDVDYITEGNARFFPTGAPNLFAQYNAPANFVETVNTVGRPLYVKQRKMDFDVGIELHAQSNPLFICKRPQCLIEGTSVIAAGSGSGSA